MSVTKGDFTAEEEKEIVEEGKFTAKRDRWGSRREARRGTDGRADGGPYGNPTEKWKMNKPGENPREPTAPPTEPPTAEWYSSGRMFCPVCSKLPSKEP